jgi:hypothetical protein
VAAFSAFLTPLNQRAQNAKIHSAILPRLLNQEF